LPQKIRLTWKPVIGFAREETCYLLQDDDEIFYHTGDESFSLGAFKDLPQFHQGLVVFEDDDGVFLLKPEQVIHIEHIP